MVVKKKKKKADVVEKLKADEATEAPVAEADILQTLLNIDVTASIK
jgi:hypothetical protein